MQPRSVMMHVVLGVVVWLAGCTTKTKDDEFVAGLKTFKDRMCACKDADCANQVHVEFEAFSTKMDHALSAKDMIRTSEGAKKEAGGYLNAYFVCETNLKPVDLGPMPQPPSPEAEDKPEAEAPKDTKPVEAAPGPRKPGQYRMKGVP